MPRYWQQLSGCATYEKVKSCFIKWYRRLWGSPRSTLGQRPQKVSQLFFWLAETPWLHNCLFSHNWKWFSNLDIVYVFFLAPQKQISCVFRSLGAFWRDLVHAAVAPFLCFSFDSGEVYSKQTDCCLVHPNHLGIPGSKLWITLFISQPGLMCCVFMVFEGVMTLLNPVCFHWSFQGAVFVKQLLCYLVCCV